MLALHFTQAGLIEAAIEWWGEAGQRSLERSALIEAIEQFTRALNLVVTIPATPVLRREQINFQVALITPLIHVKGHAAPETKAAAERARLLIEQVEALGEPPEDPLLLFSVLNSLWAVNAVAFNGDALRQLAAHLLALAEKQGATAARLIAHRAMGAFLAYTGGLVEAHEHLEKAIALYDPDEHRPLAMRFFTDVRVHAFGYRSWTLLSLGYPDAALADAERAVIEAREIGQAAVLMNALALACFSRTFCRSYATANIQVDELVALADEKDSLYWKSYGMLVRGCVLAGTGKAAEGVQMIATWFSAHQSTGSTSWIPFWSTHLAMAHAQLGQFGDAWRCIGEARTTVEKTKQRFWEAEVHRVGGEIELMSGHPDAAKAQAYFDRALAVARQQQAKSWELRASMSLARLWRDQGKVRQARELLAIRRHRSRQFGKGQIWIARAIGFLHRRITGESGRDAKLLLRPVQISQTATRRRLDQGPQPSGRPENETGVARLVAAGSCAECRQNGAIAVVAADARSFNRRSESALRSSRIGATIG